MIYDEYANDSWDNDPDSIYDWWWDVIGAENEEDPNLFGRLITGCVDKDQYLESLLALEIF